MHETEIQLSESQAKFAPIEMDVAKIVSQLVEKKDIKDCVTCSDSIRQSQDFPYVIKGTHTFT